MESVPRGLLHVKATLLREGTEEGVKEIRRFQVEEERGASGGDGGVEGGSPGLQSLLTRVHSVFNVDPAHQRCTLYWKDEDGDLIHCSREEELRHALDNRTDETLRIYVIVVNGRASEGPSAPLPEGNASNVGASRGPRVSSSFQGPLPPPPSHPHAHPYAHGPHHPPRGHPHPHGPPPPFHGPWARGGWNLRGRGGLRGGWRSGLYFGCPWNMDRAVYSCKGRKGKEHCKPGCADKKMRKVMKMMTRFQMAAAHSQDKEFHEVRQQVPAEFRQWVRQYVTTWHSQGPEAALQTAATNTLPGGVGQDFPHWLHTFLSRHHPHPDTRGETEMDMGKDEGETEKAPECLPAVYYQWLCLFLSRFFQRNSHASASADCEEGEGLQYPGGYWHMFDQEFCPKKGFGRYWKHGFCKQKKYGKHRKDSSSSESSDSDSGGKAGHKVPKGFRKFVRVSFKQLRKGKQGDKTRKMKEKATRAGLSAEVQEFVEQMMLEWRAKLSRHQQPPALATHMMEADRTLPAGLQREHFLWLVRFMARCHKWQGAAGKCGATPGCLSDDSSPEDDTTSGEEAQPEGQGCGPCPPFHPPMMGGDHYPQFTGMMAGGQYPQFTGMMGPPLPPFAMHPGMGHPFPPPPPPYGCCPAGPPGYPLGRPGQQAEEDDSNGQKTSSSNDEVERVTEGVKKM